MVPALQYFKHIKITHIALALLLSMHAHVLVAQSVLLPGDLVFVTANASNNSLGLIPLYDIEEQTTLFIRAYSADGTPQGEEVKITFRQPIAAGTNLFVGEKESSQISVSGKLRFSTFNTVLTYQKEGQNKQRFIAGISWGDAREDDFARQIPESLSGQTNAFVQLGGQSNYQYYVRHGASGTPGMLRQFTTNPKNWKGQNQPFRELKTSFTLLNPPVVQFANSMAVVNEDTDMVTLKIAIYEHDGSRLNVDVIYDSLSSVTNADDIVGFNAVSVNFTGIIGDGIYGIQVPVYNDDIFEGNETAVFTLANLSKGNYGDFIHHSLVIVDDELPDVQIAGVNNSSSQYFIELLNNAEGVVSLNGWRLKSQKEEFIITEDVFLYPNEKLRIVDASQPASANGKYIKTTIFDSFLKTRGGELQLFDFEGRMVATKQYRSFNRETTPSIKEAPAAAITNNTGVTLPGTGLAATQHTATASAGWRVVPNAAAAGMFPEVDFFIWNEALRTFTVPDAHTQNVGVLIGYFESEWLEKLTASQTALYKQNPVDEASLNIRLSSTDVNGNAVIDGLEGLNLLYNNLNTEISVQNLLQEIEKHAPQIGLLPHVYTMDFTATGEMELTLTSRAGLLKPESLFWLMVDNLTEPLELELQESALTTVNETVTETAIPDEKPELVLTASRGAFTDFVRIHLAEEEKFSPVKNIAAYPDFKFDARIPVTISVQNGENWYSKFDVLLSDGQNFSLPLILQSTEPTLKLEVSQWPEIPENWIVTLSDAEQKLEYTLNKNFVLNLVLKQNGEPAASEEQSHRFRLNFRNTDNQLIEEQNTLPKELELYQNYPNPFNPVTTISFFMPEAAEVKLSVFNIVGQPVIVLVDGTLSAGHQQFDWDATERPSGMYIYQLEVGNKVLTRKMTLVK